MKTLRLIVCKQISALEMKQEKLKLNVNLSWESTSYFLNKRQGRDIT